MKKRFLALALIMPLLISCGGHDDGEFVPEIPIEDFVPTNLPDYDERNVGQMLSDETYDYLDIYEISDFHGAVNYDEDEETIGLAKLGGYFNEKRANNPGGTVILSGGDMWQGSADSNLTRGNMVTYAMNYIGFDAMTMGNHEFDWGRSWIENNKNIAKFPILAANIYKRGTKIHDDFFGTSTVINRGDYKIGIVGTIGDSIINSIIASNVNDVYFEDEGKVVKEETQRLREEEGCDIVIWSSHNDIDIIYSKYAQYELDCDAVFGGHTHASLERHTDRVAFLETKAYGKSLTHTQLKIDKETKAVSYSTFDLDTAPYQSTASDDQKVKYVKDLYSAAYVDPVKRIKVATLNADFTIDKALSNFCVYSMQDYLKDSGLYSDYPICAAFHNKNGGVRKDIQAGDVTYGKVYESFPFDNEIVIIKVTGGILKTVFFGANNVCLWHTFSKGSDIVDDQEYYVITTDFLESNASYFKNHAGEVTFTGLLVREGVAKTMKKFGYLKAEDYISNGLKKSHMEFVKPSGL